jgi:hypothetical protein
MTTQQLWRRFITGTLMIAVLIGALLVVLTRAGSPSKAVDNPSTYLKSVENGMPSDFLAQWTTRARGNVLELFSAKSGQPLGKVVDFPHAIGSPNIEGPFRAGRGNVWLTTTSGPVETSNVMGGDPRPNSCSATVTALSPLTHRSTVIFRAPVSVQFGEAVPNSTGERFAYLDGGCSTGFMNAHVVLRSTTSSAAVTIGNHALPCHVISTPSWSPNGSLLTFAYSPSVLKPGSKFVPRGYCQAPGAGEIAVVSTSRSSEIVAGELTKAPSGCQYTESAFDAPGMVAVESCGTIGSSSTYLVQLNSRRKVLLRIALKPNSDPTSISVSPNGSYVLVNEYQADALPGNDPLDWVWVFDGHHLKMVGRYLDSSESVSSASW